MKNYCILTILIIITFSQFSCSNSFYSRSEYSNGALDNMSIAILPYDVVNTGRIPDGLSDEDIESIETAESKAFQISLHNQIVRRLDKRDNFSINVQHHSETNSLLKKEGYNLSDASNIPVADLANVLGVDVVIKSTVHKTQYLTDLESFGIQIAANILWAITDSWWWGFDTRTGDVRISSTAVDTQLGSSIWSASRNKATYWNRNTYDTIERINYRISKRMPF